MTPLPPDLAEGRRLLQEATPAPWTHDKAVPWSPRQRSDFADRGASISNPTTDAEVVVGGLQDEQGGAVGVLLNEDAAAICWLRNHAPALLDAAEERDRLRKVEVTCKTIVDSIEPWLLEQGERGACRRATESVPLILAERDAFRDRAEKAEAELARLRAALNDIACWEQGPAVTLAFDEPWSAQRARDALKPPTEEPPDAH